MQARLFSILLTLTFSSVAYAGKCEIFYERTACPGKEKISYKKCKGKQSCVKVKRAKTMESCQKIAAKACSNSRLEITKSKIIKAKFEGQEIKSTDGKVNFCAPNRPDFNKCGG